MPDYVPTRAAGLSRLQAFLPRAERYAEERNFDRVGHPTVSRLSPWLQRRLVTEEEVCASVAGMHPWEQVEKYQQEVCWRTYWKGWLEHRPAVWQRYRARVDSLQRALPSGFAEAVEGRTGIPGFDHWARELVATGWLHNHARMWFASIWVFTLRLPWELGADFFWRHLLDADAASNTLSWRWVAGLHTPGKAYLARADNIAHYTDGRFDPAGQLATLAEPLTEPALPDPVPLWTPSRMTEALAGPVGLWLHPEDLCVESVDFGADVVPVSIYAAWAEPVARAWGWSDAVVAFSQAALADGASRAALAWDADVHAVRVADMGTAALAWAEDRGLKSVIALRPAVGPWIEAGLQIEAALRSAGIKFCWYRRAWDSSLYPLARRGFFSFWQSASHQLKPRTQVAEIK